MEARSKLHPRTELYRLWGFSELQFLKEKGSLTLYANFMWKSGQPKKFLRPENQLASLTNNNL